MKRADPLRMVGVLLLLGACASWWRHAASSEMAAGSAAGADRPLRLFLTGDAAGFLAPCGCESRQYGGLPRRGAYLRQVRRPGDLAIDLGNLVTGDGVVHRTVLRHSIEGLRTLAYDALVPAEGEIRLGAFFETAASAAPGLTVVCANLRRSSDGSRVFRPWLLHPLADGRTVAVVGVAEPFPDSPPEYRIAPLADTVRDAVRELSGKADAIVVVGGLRTQTGLELAAQFPGVALVAAGWATEGSSHVVRTSGAPAMLLGEFAWYVGRVDFDASLRVADSWQAWIDEELPDDPDLAALVARSKAETSQEGAGFAAKLVESFRAQNYVGSASCTACHAEEFAAWRASGHAHAMHTLAEKNASIDPQCIVCHLVDVPAEATTPPDADALGIGCEACHGGGARHVELARNGSKEAAGALARATGEACVRCHVPPNVTHFDFASDWPKIAHGRRSER